MYPELFRIGDFPVTSYGIWLAVGMLLALFAASRLAANDGLPRERTLGTTLHTVGFPSAGGTDSRAPVTVSRGVVSGHSRAARGDEIKTDAFIAPGSSGGAAFDGSWRFVGVPVSISDESGPVLGFVVPADAVPTDWLR